ncbi:hypothetical protein [Thiomicrorhabdus sediminis]|uniref:NlpE N-terminal domain-containing protein n=1 Tax=Thiomicrorhabdus sediminis TaxID=2580412 RepID=A0A4P9K833_9GAMM|nr:hypothetical protein [Thiomicrorhabdus sediminis]QCU90546.1 hypothetical protein FE785_07820 [Thiomicrorhabdus sediminis]
MKKLLLSLAVLPMIFSQAISAKEVSLKFTNLKGMSCYSTAPVGCNSDKVADTKATYFRDAKGNEKLLYQSMEYEAFPSPAEGSASFAAVESNSDKGWAVMELITLDLVNKKVSIVGARSNSIYSKPVYQLFGDIEPVM